MLIKVFR